MSKKYHIARREFPNQFTGMRAHIIALVEDTRDISQDESDSWKWSEIKLMLSDCYDDISFEFDLSSAELRENSLHKIRLMAEIINAFREAIELEAESIAERQSFIPLAKAAGTVH
jgi:hypothetical protein